MAVPRRRAIAERAPIAMSTALRSHARMSLRLTVAMSVCAATAACLTSCYPGHGGITLSAEESQLPRCAGVDSVDVERLEDPNLFDDCEPIDVPVIFPDGYVMSIEEHAGSSVAVPGSGPEPATEYGLSRLGVYGLVASLEVPGKSVQRWGTPIGLCLVSGMEDEQRNMTSGDCR